MQHTLTVNNIKCGGCANSISIKLNKIKGISSINVDVDQGQVSFDAVSDGDHQHAVEVLEKMGYTQDDPTLLQSARSYVSCVIGRVK